MKTTPQAPTFRRQPRRSPPADGGGCGCSGMRLQSPFITPGAQHDLSAAHRWSCGALQVVLTVSLCCPDGARHDILSGRV